MNIGEIARRSGVARSTVSYALSGKRTISGETRRRVLQVIEELGFRPNASARALAEGRTRTIGLVIPPATHRLIDTQLAILASLNELASASDLDVLMSPSSGDHDRSFLRMISGQRVDGVLLMEVRMEDHRIDALERSGLPYVVVGRPAEPDELFWVDIDYIGLVQRCVNHMADLGHRNIALINRPAEMVAAGYGPGRRAIMGFDAAVKKRGLRGWSFTCSDSASGGEACMKQILAGRPRITAAVTINEGALPGIARALERARVVVPRDFSIAGAVSGHWALEFEPHLTAADVSATDLARHAFEMLIERIARPDSEPRNVLLSPEITLRSSTARALAVSHRAGAAEPDQGGSDPGGGQEAKRRGFGTVAERSR